IRGDMKSIFRPNPERMRLKGDLSGLLRLLDGKNDTGLRIEAILALGRMKTPVAVEELIRLFQDPEYGVRNAASTALVHIGSDAIHPLVHALSVSDDQTARMIHSTLITMGDEAAREIVKNITSLQGIGYERAGYVLNWMGTRIIPVLIDAFGTQDHTTNTFIEGILESFGMSSIQPLINGLNHDHEEV